MKNICDAEGNGQDSLDYSNGARGRKLGTKNSDETKSKMSRVRKGTIMVTNGLRAWMMPEAEAVIRVQDSIGRIQFGKKAKFDWERAGKSRQLIIQFHAAFPNDKGITAAYLNSVKGKEENKS